MQIKHRKVFIINGVRYKVVEVVENCGLTIFTLESKMKSKSLLIYGELK